MPFAYLRDPLFLVCLTVYGIHRLLRHTGLELPLLQAYLNDLICIPFWVPIMLWGLRRLRLRGHDAPPQSYEVVIPVILWSVVFEIILPQTRTWSGLAYADPNDVLCYALGGLVALQFWSWYYGEGRPKTVAG